MYIYIYIHTHTHRYKYDIYIYIYIPRTPLQITGTKCYNFPNVLYIPSFLIAVYNITCGVKNLQLLKKLYCILVHENVH